MNEAALAYVTLKGSILSAMSAAESLPNSREKSLALTKLEEAEMWADKGMQNAMRNPPQ